MYRFIPALILCLSLAASAAGQESWTDFRGPDWQGTIAADERVPIHWSEQENIVWKTPLPGRAWSSPVILGDQIWMTNAPEDGTSRWAVCLDRSTGRVLHEIKVIDVPQPEEKHALNSYASPTAAIEPGRVYVHFGSVGTAAIDTENGKILWSRRDLRCDHFRGAGSSPILFDNRLILIMDGMDVQYVVALDPQTGRTLWKTDRSIDYTGLDPDICKAYSTPLVVEAAGRTQLITTPAQGAIAYDARTGEDLWQVAYPGGYSNVSRPVAAGGLVYVNSGFGRPVVLAVRPDGRGDVTDTHVVWRCDRRMPAKPSPVIVGGRWFSVADDGIAICLDAATGEELWTKRLGGEFSASLLAVGDRLYAFDQTGTATVFRAADKYEELAENRLDDGCMASPAVVDGALYVRTETHLYRIEKR